MYKSSRRLIFTVVFSLFSSLAFPNETIHSSSGSSSSSVAAPVTNIGVNISEAPTNFNQDIKSKSTVIGLATAANPATCYVPIFAGLLQMQDETCTMIKEAVLLHQFGAANSAHHRLCQSATMRKAFKDAGNELCLSAYPEFPFADYK
jgi:hypothetical protein